MKRNIIVGKQALSADICNHIIEVARPNFERALTGTGEDINSIRRSKVSWLGGAIKHLDIYMPICQIIQRLNAEFYHFDLTDPEAFQITKYDEKNQGFYKPHQDQQYDFADRQQTVRKLSMSIQLTSPEHYEGGQLQFPDDKDSFNVEDAMDQGTVVFFPSYIKHGVTPVTKGIRYSLVCWIHGPNFK